MCTLCRLLLVLFVSWIGVYIMSKLDFLLDHVCIVPSCVCLTCTADLVYILCTLDCLLYHIYIVLSSVCLSVFFPRWIVFYMISTQNCLLHTVYSVLSFICLAHTLDYFLYHEYIRLSLRLCVHFTVFYLFNMYTGVFFNLTTLDCLLHHVYAVLPYACVGNTLDCFLYYMYTRLLLAHYIY